MTNLGLWEPGVQYNLGDEVSYQGTYTPKLKIYVILNSP